MCVGTLLIVASRSPANGSYARAKWANVLGDTATCRLAARYADACRAMGLNAPQPVFRRSACPVPATT